jgi:hypothetical protein
VRTRAGGTLDAASARLRRSATRPEGGNDMNTRTIAIAALVIAVIVLLLLVL